MWSTKTKRITRSKDTMAASITLPLYENTLFMKSVNGLEMEDSSGGLSILLKMDDCGKQWIEERKWEVMGRFCLQRRWGWGWERGVKEG